MANIIEKLLEEKSKGTECEVFYTQWLLAKDYVPKVQSLIIRTFPHYSLHDSTHSQTILNCIVRVLGTDAIAKLGAVDLWLLLAAAYYHDFGMAVFARDLETIFKDVSFFSFVKECQEDPDNALYPFASVFEIKKDGLYYKNVVLEGETYDGSRYLLAEYIRREHAKRSSTSLSLDESIHLAGDPIPERIIRLLGRICESHTQSFGEVMKLPYCETGLGMEDCHPRFVACMLRIGDLLDIDNNRFSSVLLKTLTVIPRDSVLHKKKHLAVEHLRIDSNRIEVSARTDDYDVADISNRWLEMIEDEFRRQRDVWQEIVPDSFPAYLPAVGELKVDLIGYDTINGKKRPGFEIDTSKAMEMLQGAGLYTKPSQCVRELLQNAVDATYLAIFNEFGELSLDEFSQACSKKQINVSISKTAVDGNDVIWTVRIEDYGTGMSKEDLRYLTRTGSKNPDKVKQIHLMPDYMRPSGTFGIGFQSVFLISDKVVLKTRKRDSAQEVTAELFNPSGPRKGAVLLKTEPGLMNYGTIISFDFRSDKNLDHWSISSGEQFATLFVNSFDFVGDKTLDLDTAKIMDEVATFSRACPIPISLTVDGQEISLSPFKGRDFDYYSSGNGLQISVDFRNSYYVDLFYRNQPVQKSGIHLPFLGVTANILGGDAKDILTLNRNETRGSIRIELRERITNALKEALENKPEIVPVEVKPFASMFVNCYYHDSLHLFPIFRDSWKDYVHQYYAGGELKSVGYSFGHIVEMAKNKNIVWHTEGNNTPFVKEEADAIEICGDGPNEETFSFLLDVLFKNHPYPCNDISNYSDKAGYMLSRTPLEPIADWRKWVNKYFNNALYGRSLMPCNSDFSALRINPSAHFLFSYDTTFGVNDYPKMICPYVRKMGIDSWYPRATALEWNDADGELYNLTYENRADKSVTMDDIKKAYDKFRAILDPIISAEGAIGLKSTKKL